MPPIEDLHITVDDSVQFQDVGKIASIVEVLGKLQFFTESTFVVIYAVTGIVVLYSYCAMSERHGAKTVVCL